MKSIKTKILNFTFEDFEEGLMLAGFISPASVSDIQKKESLLEYDKELGQEKRHLFFKRVTLAAKIVDSLYEESTMGKIKFQKLMYLCENISNMKLADRYMKAAAGPFDARFMHSIEKEFVKNKWFKAEKVNTGSFNRIVYQPLENNKGYITYYNSYFANYNANIEYLIELFRKQKTDFTEIVATLYACIMELNISEFEDTTRLLELFYEWSKEKERFTKEQVINALDWMTLYQILPH